MTSPTMPSAPAPTSGVTVNAVADRITYLRREGSGHISGATYDVNGGAHIR
jgi:hypothetical protein